MIPSTLCRWTGGLFYLATTAWAYGTSPRTFEVDSNAILISTGTETGTSVLTSAEEGAGTRLLWYPGKAAFRAGYVSGTDWNDSNMGAYSAALGQDTTASGSYSFAVGYGATASGSYSFAQGSNSLASGASSFAGGDSFATGSNSVALGMFATASGNYSVALGLGQTASAQGSLATGGGTQATGSYSATFNYYTAASGVDSAAFNYYTTASSYNSTAFGQYNLNKAEGGGTPSSTTWVSTAGAADPLYEIGDGTASAPSDALAVYKDGVVAVHTKLRCAAGGDLSMGSFTAGTAP